MTSPEKKKAPAATGAIGTDISKTVRKESVINIIPREDQNFQASFTVQAKRTLIWVTNQTTYDGAEVVELTDDGDSNMLLSPSEALSLAAALQAVAVHLMEQETAKDLVRRTEPGEPELNGIGGGL